MEFILKNVSFNVNTLAKINGLRLSRTPFE